MDGFDGRQVIGGETRRIDAFAKVTGRTKYVPDMRLPDLLHARVLRSPYHHAHLLSLNTSAAIRVPGVIRIITAEDIPGVNGFPEYSHEEPLLTPVGDTMKTKGAPIALIVAESQKAAQAALGAISVEYEPLSYSFETNSEIPIYPGGDRLKEHQVIQRNVAAAFSKSEIILETQYATSYQEHAALESETALGFLDEAGRVTVMGGTHEPHWQLNWIAEALDLPLDQVRFITPPTGGSFGGKQDPWPLVAAGLMTHLTRKPVRLVYSRSESFEASPKRHPYQMQYKIGVDRDKKLTGIQVRIEANTGGYDSAGYYIPEYAVMAAGGAYQWEAADIYAQSIYSNGPKSGQFRGFGSPQSTFALECTLDEMIQRLDADPIEFRLRNKIDQDSDTFLGYPVAENLGYTEVLEALRSRYQEFQKSVQAFNANNSDTPIRAGVGVAGMWYRFGKSGNLRIEAHAELVPDGRFVVYCSAPDYGQGIGTVMLQLAAETLGIPRDYINLVNADTAQTPDSDVQGASRATYWVGNAVCEAAQTLKAEILGTAAEVLDCDPDSLALDVNKVISLNDPSKNISLQDLVKEFDHIGKSRKVRGFFDPSPLFPEANRPTYTPHFVTGAHMAEVRVDMETGEVRVTRYVAVHDVGRAINPIGAEGQVEGAVIMGLGAALTEAYIPGKTTGLSDYILPMIGEIPEIEVVLVEVPSRQGPLGAKGLGEAAMLPSTPAIINAASRAIGVRVRQIPATPERILNTIRQNNQFKR
ncbi:MAG: xanthine dehydrogenase family protein molybdopterin-binding subunit [Anaerolineales bacterium]|jgi:CO/xanthine dehydrogenase Mo-binding subunit